MKKRALIAAATAVLLLAGCHHRNKKTVEGNNMSASASNTMSPNATDKPAISNGSNTVAPTNASDSSGGAKTNGDR